MQPRLFRLHRSHLEEKDAGDDLQAARNIILHLLQQRFALNGTESHGSILSENNTIPPEADIGHVSSSLLSVHCFPVMPKSFPVSFHREYR
jgi:hypothetical protein